MLSFEAQEALVCSFALLNKSCRDVLPLALGERGDTLLAHSVMKIHPHLHGHYGDSGSLERPSYVLIRTTYTAVTAALGCWHWLYRCS